MWSVPLMPPTISGIYRGLKSLSLKFAPRNRRDRLSSSSGSPLDWKSVFLAYLTRSKDTFKSRLMKDIKGKKAIAVTPPGSNWVALKAVSATFCFEDMFPCVHCDIDTPGRKNYQQTQIIAKNTPDSARCHPRARTHHE